MHINQNLLDIALCIILIIYKEITKQHEACLSIQCYCRYKYTKPTYYLQEI